MQIYIKNTDTNEIISIEADSYESLSKNFRKAPYELASSSEIDSEILKEAKSSRIASRRAYIVSKDWYIAREADTPNSYPVEVKNKRILARTEINAIEALTVLADVERYSEIFE